MNIKPLLKDIGLTDNEIAVYVTLLSLGPATMQILARKAKVPRATTYTIIDSLIKQGLVTKYKEGIKTLVIAETPQQLFHLIERQEHILQTKRLDIEQALPTLQAMQKKASQESSVRFFTGLDGLRAMRQEMLMYSTSRDTWYMVVPLDSTQQLFGERDFLYDMPRLAKRIKVKMLFTTASKELKQKLLALDKHRLTERKWLPAAAYTTNTGSIVYRDRVAFCSYDQPISGLVIESRPIADAMRQSFLLMWQSTK